MVSSYHIFLDLLHTSLEDRQVVHLLSQFLRLQLDLLSINHPKTSGPF